MADFETLSQDIYCIDALYVKPRVASIYLVREGDEVAIVETGTLHSLENVLATMEALEIDRSQIKYVIPTHVHLDHAGGAGSMMRHFEQAELLIHPRGAAHMINPEKLIAGTVGVYGQETFERLYGKIEPIDETRVRIIEDGETASLESRELVFIDTPGHAYHHFCIYDASSGGVFTGDSFGISYDPMKLLANGLLPSTPPTQFDPPALHATVDKIMNFQPQRLYLTHYGEYLNPAARADSFHRWIDRYVEMTGEFHPQDADDSDELENELTRVVLESLSDTPQSLDRILKTDLHLNAQGLAWWWQKTQNA